MTRKGGLKEVMRGINGGIKRLIKLLTMKYYYHCFINSPKVHQPKGTYPTYTPHFWKVVPDLYKLLGKWTKEKIIKEKLMANLQEATLWLS